MLIDSHCHLDSDQFDQDREEVIQRALDAGVSRMVAIGTGNGPPDLEAGIRLADKYESFYATVGVHPHDASKHFDEAHLRDLTQHPKVIAIGEIGLDYHYDFSPREVQHAVFIRQMQIAQAAKKPIVIHTREAWNDTIQLIRNHWDPAIGGIMHCFSGNPEQAKQALDLGFYLSFGGIVTFPKALEIQQSAREAPIDRILVETDAPYLAPVPKRGKRNEPAFMIETVKKLATLRGVSEQSLAASTTTNFHRLCAFST
ncbi:MAG TPA: TatD family hydrolase [Bryobacteraceae bacterium]|nr:TatD family hydrolase [Bryobacteraceae bacterium]